MKFSDLVKQKRELLNLKLKEIEEKTNITASYISRIEKGQINGVSGENVFKLAKALDIPLNEIAQSFGVELSNTTNDNIINSLKRKFDYMLVNEAIDSIINIANNNDDEKHISNLIKIISKLKKPKITIVGMTNDGNADYIVEVDYFDIEAQKFVADRLRNRLGANVMIIEGRYSNGDNFVNFYEIEDFIEDFIEDDFEKEEVYEYLNIKK